MEANINRQLHEALGLPLKEYPLGVRVPNYCADPRLVLRAMTDRKDGKLFFATIMYAPSKTIEAIDDDGYIDRDLILDQTGKLAKLALEFLEGREK